MEGRAAAKKALAIVTIVAFVSVYGAAVWAILAFVPALSVAATTVPMTGRLWVYAAGGFVWGMLVGVTFIQWALGARPLAYGQSDYRGYREPKTALGSFCLLAIATAVGVLFANQAVEYAQAPLNPRECKRASRSQALDRSAGSAVQQVGQLT